MIKFKKYYGILYLAALFIIVPLVIWNLSVRDTINAQGRLKELNQELDQLRAKQNSNATTQLSRSSDDIIGGGGLLSSLQHYSQLEGVTLERYTPYVTSREENTRIVTAEVVVQGNYIPIVKIFKHIEDNITQCKPLSANFKIYIDRHSKERHLRSTILIQQIVQNQ